MKGQNNSVDKKVHILQDWAKLILYIVCMYAEYLQFTQIVIFPGNRPPPRLCSLCPLQKIGVWCMYWFHLSQSENKIVSHQPIAAGEQTTLLKEAV